jgi:hypothetical protein
MPACLLAFYSNFKQSVTKSGSIRLQPEQPKLKTSKLKLLMNNINLQLLWLHTMQSLLQQDDTTNLQKE